MTLWTCASCRGMKLCSTNYALCVRWSQVNLQVMQPVRVDRAAGCITHLPQATAAQKLSAGSWSRGTRKADWYFAVIANSCAQSLFCKRQVAARCRLHHTALIKTLQRKRRVNYFLLVCGDRQRVFHHTVFAVAGLPSGPPVQAAILHFYNAALMQPYNGHWAAQFRRRRLLMKFSWQRGEQNAFASGPERDSAKNEYHLLAYILCILTFKIWFVK